MLGIARLASVLGIHLCIPMGSGMHLCPPCFSPRSTPEPIFHPKRAQVTCLSPTLSWWNDYLACFLHEKTILMSYKYLMNPSSSRFIIFSFSAFLACIFLKSDSLKYHCTFYFYKVIDLNTWEFSHPSKGAFTGISRQLSQLTKHQLLATLTYWLPTSWAFYMKLSDILIKENKLNY